jgi:hypothetical protein
MDRSCGLLGTTVNKDKKMVIRIIGILFIIGALLAAGFEVAGWASSGSYKSITLGGLWYEIHRSSLNGAQAGVQRYLAPWLWDPIIIWILVRPVWLIAGVPGLLLTWLGWPRKTKRRKRFHLDH